MRCGFLMDTLNKIRGVLSVRGIFWEDFIIFVRFGKSMSMKIYFAGSIRGGRSDKDLYSNIITHLKNHGEVLTEHIGDESLTAHGEMQLTDDEICERDIEWIRSADVIVAEVTNPSLGVGYELGLAEALGKKIICLFRLLDDKRLSAMINGNKNFKKSSYSCQEGALKHIDDFFLSLK